jgi:hypothetical protein
VRAELVGICAREGWDLRVDDQAMNGPVLKYRGHNCFSAAINPVWMGVASHQRVRAVQIRFVAPSDRDRCPLQAWRYHSDEGDSANFLPFQPDASVEELLPLLRIGYERCERKWSRRQ